MDIVTSTSAPGQVSWAEFSCQRFIRTSGPRCPKRARLEGMGVEERELTINSSLEVGSVGCMEYREGRYPIRSSLSSLSVLDAMAWHSAFGKQDTANSAHVTSPAVECQSSTDLLSLLSFAARPHSRYCIGAISVANDTLSALPLRAQW